jgi:hypothetical protein
MARYPRCVLFGLVVAFLGITAGCDPGTMSYFLMGSEPRIEPVLRKLASDEGKEVKVLVLTYRALETRSELVQADRELTSLLVTKLREGCAYNKEKVSVISASKVDAYKAAHPDWHKYDLQEIGQDFQADYVVYLELNKLSLYEDRSSNTLYRGKADITVTLVDVKHTENEPVSREVPCTFPKESKFAFDASDKTPAQFRRDFLSYVAKKVSWLFTSHPTDQEYDCE